MKRRIRKWLSVLLVLSVIVSVATISALAVTASDELPVADPPESTAIADGSDYLRYAASRSEAEPSETATLNDIRDNAELAELSGSPDEAYGCYWITDAAGKRILDLEPNQTYTSHLYLRCSGKSGEPVRDVTVCADLLTETKNPVAYRGVIDIWYTNELDERYMLALIDLNPGFLKYDCCPQVDSVAVKTIDGEPVTVTGELFYGLGLRLPEIENGLEHAIIVTFQFTTAERDQPAPSADSPKTTDTTEARPQTPPIDKPPQLEVISAGELGDLKAKSGEIFREENPPTRATMNSIINNPEWGDERQFLQITNLNTGESSRTNMILEPNQTYEIEVYLRNDHDALMKNEELGLYNEFKAVLSAPLPFRLAAGEVSDFTATFTSKEAMPNLITANLRLLSREDLTLKYVDGSAAQNAQEWERPSPIDYYDLLTGTYTFKHVRPTLGYARHVTYTIAAIATPGGNSLGENDWLEAQRGFCQTKHAAQAASPNSPTGAHSLTRALLMLALGLIVGMIFGGLLCCQIMGVSGLVLCRHVVRSWQAQRKAARAAKHATEVESPPATPAAAAPTSETDASDQGD